ncbi:MAG: aldo/keto reductase [Halobacteriaceae archaeon]
MATAQATFDYRDRHDGFARTHFRRVGSRAVSSVGLGTHQGAPTGAVDDDAREALVAALEAGSNVVDTAANYRAGRSEPVVGDAIAAADVPRESVFVATKGGYVPFDGERPSNPGRYVYREFVETGLVDEADLAHGQHSVAPAFVDAMLDRSLSRLGLDTVDCYYVHEPEVQLDVRSRAAVYDALETTFRLLEERAAAGDIRHYGVATWDAFRVPRGHDRYLSLPEVVSRARAAAEAAGADSTHLRCLQVPFNVTMADAFTVEAHRGAEGDQCALWFARDAGLDVFTSAALAQGRLTDEAAFPEDVYAELAGETPAQRAINFARSAPGVTAALVGTTDAEHAREDVDAGRHEPLGAGAFDAVFE